MRHLTPVIWLLLAGCAIEDAPPVVIPETGCDPASNLQCIYEGDPPDVSACLPGALTADWAERARVHLNAIRAASGLPAVKLDAARAAGAQACALIAAANRAPYHTPPATAACWTADAAAACEDSNVAYSSFSLPLSAAERVAPHLLTPEFALENWLEDVTPEGDLGHRRWLLHPFLRSVAFGMVHDKQVGASSVQVGQGAVLTVAGGAEANLSALDLDFVAYPRGDYPAEWVSSDWLLSFAVLVDKSDVAANAAVDYKAAVVTVTSGTGASVPVSGIAFRNDYTGLPNHLQFQADGVTHEVEYTVQIEGVLVAGAPRDYTWTFRLVEAAP